MGVDIKTELEAIAIEDLEDIIVAANYDPGPVDVTKDKLLSVIVRLRAIQINNGYHGIAIAEDIPAAWVKEIDAVRKEVLNESVIGELEAEEL